MDQDQFRQFTEALADHERERRQAQANRETIKDLIKQTTTCDGSTQTLVRNWLREVTLALDQVGAGHVIEIASKTVSGPLRYEIERYITTRMAADHLARRAIPWNDLKAHVSRQFLNTDEASALRAEVEKVTQSPYESEASYTRRFRDVADVAYPVANRNADQHRIMIRAYGKGLRSGDLARKLIEENNPQDITAAMDAIAQLSERREAFERLGRGDNTETAVASATAKPISPPTSPTNARLQNTVASLASTVQKLHTKVAKLEVADLHKAPMQQKHRQWRPQNLPAWDANGNPRCYACGTYGHLAKQCQKNTRRKPTKNDAAP